MDAKCDSIIILMIQQFFSKFPSKFVLVLPRTNKSVPSIFEKQVNTTQ